MTGKRGFTLIELLVVLAVVGTLLALAAPHYLGSVDKAKEVVLRENLSTMRATLDKFYADTGKYPDSLEELVSMRYLRVIPIDPLLDSNSAWVVIAPPEKTKKAIYDVKSATTGTTRNGNAYQDW